MPESVAPLLPQPVHLPAQLVRLLRGASVAHQRLQQLQNSHNFVHQADQGLTPEPVNDSLKFVSEHSSYVVDVHNGQFCRRSVQRRRNARFHVF